MAKKNDIYVAEQEVQLEEEGNEKNEMVSCIKFRNKMSPGNGDNKSLTNLQRMCSKFHLCGMENERVWFLRSATMTTKYPIQEHMLNTN